MRAAACSVVAIDAAGNASRPLSTSVTLPDGIPPTWPPDSALELVAVTPTSATLRWTAAGDDVAVTGYLLSRDLVVVDTLVPETRETLIEGLRPGTDYTFSVTAFDAEGNRTLGLQLTIRTADDSAPVFGPAARVLASDVGPEALSLGWSPALDDVAVQHYLVSRDGAEDLVVDATSTRVEGLTPWTEYTFRVQAVDAAGNPSLDGPAVTVRTLDGGARRAGTYAFSISAQPAAPARRPTRRFLCSAERLPRLCFANRTSLGARCSSRRRL